MSCHAAMRDASVRDALEGHAMAWFPREACALLVRTGDGLRAILTDNVIDTSPEGSRRTSADGYRMDPMEIVSAARRGEELLAIVHSHVRATAGFSDEDHRQATTADGEPLYPGVGYVVLDAHDDGVHGYRVFEWASQPATFVEVTA